MLLAHSSFILISIFLLRWIEKFPVNKLDASKMITFLINNILVVFSPYFFFGFCFFPRNLTCVSRSKCTTFGCVFERCERIHDDQPWAMIAVSIYYMNGFCERFFIDRWIARTRIYCYSIRSYTCCFHSFVHRNKGGVINMRRKPFKIETHTNKLQSTAPI